jgi:predicted nucleic acid-binding protein
MTDQLRLFIDSNVLIAGSVSTHEASFVVLQLAELRIVTALISEQVMMEVERNLALKLPVALPAFRTLVEAALARVPDPPADMIAACASQADLKDAPLLAAALQNECRFLLTHNTRHFWPAGKYPSVMTPGKFLTHLRSYLSAMAE